MTVEASPPPRIARVLRVIAALAIGAAATVRGAPPVDHATSVQPIFEASCGGGSCHIGSGASGVDLSSYDALMTSLGVVYGEPVVVPGSAAASPLWDQVAGDPPRLGTRMPPGGQLSAGDLDLLMRWIDEGAERTARGLYRGDVDNNGSLEITDAIRVLDFLFSGGAGPHCAPVADANGDGDVDITDPVSILGFLFLGSREPGPLTAGERDQCRLVNHAPSISPLGEVHGSAGTPIELTITASDSDGDALEYHVITAPDGVTLDAATGALRWTPGADQAGVHSVEIEVVDDGEPPLSARATGSFHIEGANSPPSVPARRIVRVYPGRELALSLDATDPDGDALAYEAAGIPGGATLDGTAGTLHWVPPADQVGNHFIHFTVRDAGTPPAAAEGLLVVSVLPEGPCDDPVCTPAGCEPRAKPASDECCAAPPSTRVPEPVVECPEGRALHLGRNSIGFGRLFNCDRVEIATFAQGGSHMPLNIEARCMRSSELVDIHVQLETETAVVLDVQRTIILTPRADGYAQSLGRNFGLKPGIDFFALHGLEAILTATLTDFDGAVATERLHVVLAVGDLQDLPETQ